MRPARVPRLSGALVGVEDPGVEAVDTVAEAVEAVGAEGMVEGGAAAGIVPGSLCRHVNRWALAEWVSTIKPLAGGL